jgi:hypothetical protein
MTDVSIVTAVNNVNVVNVVNFVKPLIPSRMRIGEGRNHDLYGIHDIRVIHGFSC